MTSFLNNSFVEKKSQFPFDKLSVGNSYFDLFL